MITTRSISRALLFLTALSFVAYAQRPQTVIQTDANLRRHIAFLASDQLEGRRTGEKGATLASTYISRQFAQYGVRPGVRSKSGRGSYLQPFPYVTGVGMAKTGNEFRLEFSKDGSRMNVEDLNEAKPVGFSPNANVANAKVVFAGFGIVAQDPKFDDYANVDAKGKVVLIFDGNPETDNPHSAFGRFDVRTKALIAKDKGAVGVLLISREQNFQDEKLGAMRYEQTQGEAALPTFVISRNTAANILGVKEDDLKTIEGFTAAKKTPGATVNVNIPDTSPVVSFKVNLVKKTSPAFNVIGVLPGTDPKLKGEAIIIGAHYDHLGRGGQGSLAANSTEIHHGADDNASGTAAILELARQFARQRKNKRTLIFMAFSGEEEGLLGSKYYVNHPVWPLEKTVAMINLDMVGRLKDDKLNIGGIGTSKEWKALVESLNNNRSLTTGSVALTGGRMAAAAVTAPSPTFNLALNEDGYGPSDHSSFYGKKVPVLFFFTGTHTDYHKPTDTAEKINYDGTLRLIHFVSEITRSVDKNPQRPTYTVAKSTGTTGGRAAFNVSLGTIPSYGDTTDGMVIDGVRDDSPASRAGLKTGDKIVKLAGKDVRNAMDYTFVLGTMKAGEEYEVEIIRGGEKMTLKIVPVKR